ncbi:MAG TPA: helicase-associated domain-containing protein [Acidobacteriota bacterium]|nr:helicase-associated domain-containing protein [Acidobacteriota bacterium]
MKLYAFPWERFLARLPHWERLGRQARRAYLQASGDPANLSRVQFEGGVEELLEEGFLLPHMESQLVRVPPRQIRYRKLMRTLAKQDVLGRPSANSFSDYLNRHFPAEIQATLIDAHPVRGHQAREALFQQVAGEEWISAFLELTQGDDFERRHLNPDERPFLITPKNLGEMQRLLKLLIERGGPVRISALTGPFEVLHLQMLIPAGLRYLLLYPGLEEDSLLPVVGLWPGALRRLRAPAPQPPQPVEVEAKHFSAFLMEDMTKVLVAASQAPLRLKASDSSLYQRDSRRIEETLSRLPQWLETSLSFPASKRVEEAVAYLRQMEYITKERGSDGESLQPTDKGAEWLAASAQERLQELLQQVRQGTRRRYHKRSFLPWDIEIPGVKPPPDLKEAVCASFLSLPEEGFFGFQSFARYQSVNANPLLDLRRRGETFSLSLGWKRFYRPNAEKLEQVWSNLLAEFLHTRLLPLGCAQAGRGPDGGLCFALSAMGRYLLGQGPAPSDLRQDEQGCLMVQPDFEVVFLSPAPLAEAEIGRFAQRLGKGEVGALFKITREAVQAAVGSGMDARAILSSLDQACTTPIPSNVRTEIEGWAYQCSRVKARRTLLIECPDGDTAARVLSAGGKKVELLNSTTLALLDPAFRRTLFKRLRKKGVFLEETKDT